MRDGAALADTQAVRALLGSSILVVAVGCQSAAHLSQPQDPCRGDNVICIQSKVLNQIDVLFVVDDAPSMSVKLATLRAALPQLASRLDAYAAGGLSVSLHVGVVTADLGAGPAALPQFGCRPGGDGAVLRATAGVRFIDVDQVTGNNNVGDVPAALAALMDVGTSGCEFRHPLEAAYRALHDQIPDNAGFLRPEALLSVVFVSDADDCSAPATTDLFDGNAATVAAYGPLDRFRCTQFGIACNGAPVPAAPVAGLTGCTSQRMADGGKLFDIDRYIALFTKPAAQGGIKVDPSDVILTSLTAPADPVAVEVESPCADAGGGTSCPVVAHSCVSADDPTLFGDPAVRLESVVKASANQNTASICAGDYAAAVADALPRFYVEDLGVPCLAQAVAVRADGMTDCSAEDLTTSPDGSTTITTVPSCVENGGIVPCWRLEDLLEQYQTQGCTSPSEPSPPTCTLPLSCRPVINPADGTTQLYTVVVDRGIDASGNPLHPPNGTTTRVACSSVSGP